MEAHDIQHLWRTPGQRAWKACLQFLFIAAMVLFIVRPADAGTYFMYRDQPLRLKAPKIFALPHQRLHPFDYRKEYTPGQDSRREWFTKSLPPLDPRVKSTVTFTVDFEDFLLECENSIRSVMTRNRETENTDSFLSWETQITEPLIGRAMDSGESGTSATRSRPEFRGPVHLAASGGEMQTAPEDMPLMLAGIARAITRDASIEVKIDTLVSLGSPGLRNVPFLLLYFAHEPRLAADEKNHLRQYLRGGGFALVSCEPPSVPDALLPLLLPDSQPGEVQVKSIPRSHSLYRSFFDLPDGVEVGPGASPTAEAPVGIWIKDRLAAVCMSRGSGFWKERAPDDPELKLLVNMVMFALGQPGGIATTGGGETGVPR